MKTIFDFTDDELAEEVSRRKAIPFKQWLLKYKQLCEEQHREAVLDGCLSTATTIEIEQQNAWIGCKEYIQKEVNKCRTGDGNLITHLITEVIDNA
jgi:hypothetical protein